MEHEKCKSAKEHKSKSLPSTNLCAIFIIFSPNGRFKLVLGAFVPLCLVLLAGCAQSQKEIIKEVSIENTEISQAMQAAEDVLGKMHFAIEKADYNKGFIRTRPLPGAQFFEFWRSDNVGFENGLLSNLHSIRRIVELNMNQQNGDLNIDCLVRIQRLSMPQREITSSARAYQMFSRSSLYLQRLQLNPEQEAGMAWLDLEPDKELETEILGRISSMIDRQNLRTSNESPATGDES